MHPVNKYIVLDPDNCEHHVILDNNGAWWGAENLARHYHDQPTRQIAKQGVLRAMERSDLREGLWGSYVWLRVYP